MKLVAAGLDLLKHFEGLQLQPYMDPVGIWSIGWGHVIRDDQGRMLRGEADRAAAYAIYPEGLTLAQADDLLRGDLERPAARVRTLVKVPLTDNQYAALVSFEYNVGSLGTSTLLKKLNKGDYRGAAEEFTRWDKARNADGRLEVLPGLVARRAAEQELFLT